MGRILLQKELALILFSIFGISAFHQNHDLLRENSKLYIILEKLECRTCQSYGECAKVEGNLSELRRIFIYCISLNNVLGH